MKLGSIPAVSVRQLLGTLILVTALPLLILAAILYQQLLADEGSGIRAGLLTNARSLAALVDNEIDTHVAIARTLATSPALDAGDIRGFEIQAKKALQELQGAWINLSDPTGRVLMSTLPDASQPNTEKAGFDARASALATGNPQVSDVGPQMSGRLGATIEFPVSRSDGVRYLLTMGLSPDRFLALLLGKFDASTVVAIVDRQHKFMARVPDHESRLGHLASEGWRAAMAKTAEGFTETPTLEGKMSLMAYAPTRDGWTVGIARPLGLLQAPARRIWWTLAAIGAILTSMSLALGLGLGQPLSTSMVQLAADAQKAGTGEVVAFRQFPVREASVVSQALHISSEALHRREASLRDANATFRQLVDNSPFGIYVVDGDFRLMQVSSGAQKVFENVSPLIGRDFAEILRTIWPEPAATEFISRFRHTLATGEPYRAPSTVEKRADVDEVQAYDWKIERIALPNCGEGVVCHFYDLSERQRLESALRESEARFRGTFENASVGVAHVDLDGRWIMVNNRLCQILGYSREELTILSYEDVTHPDDLPSKRDSMIRLLAGEMSSYAADQRYLRKDGSEVWVGLTVSVQRDAAGNPLYCIAIVRDITERRKAEIHQQFLLGEVAHRSKNQLAVIQAMMRQTARSAVSLADFQQRFEQRVHSIAVSTDLLVAQNWRGASMAELVGGQVEPFVVDKEHLSVEGPAVSVSADAAHAIGLALHELATNCVKHGAWSNSQGSVAILWTVEREQDAERNLKLSWREHGGPPVEPPRRRGFGHIVIEEMVAQKLNAHVEMSYAPDGVVWTLALPAQQFAEDN